jgi:hypothetical protein
LALSAHAGGASAAGQAHATPAMPAAPPPAPALPAPHRLPDTDSAARWLRPGSHALVVAAGWLLFFWGWQRVLARGADFSELRLLVLGAMVVVPVVTVSWILHNRGIHRRKGPRRRVPAALLDYRVDFHGREVQADFAALAHVQRIEIELEGASKRYVTCAAADWRASGAGSNVAERARIAIEQAGSAPANRSPSSAQPCAATVPGAEAAIEDAARHQRRQEAR